MEKKNSGRRGLKKSPAASKNQRLMAKVKTAPNKRIVKSPKSPKKSKKPEKPSEPVESVRPERMLEYNFFGRRIPDDELIAMSPSDAKDLLNGYALAMQVDEDCDFYFERILMYLHKYMMNLSYHHYIIKGYDGKDLYQESQITLRFKAIPNFDANRGMSFLNFAKMCINRHLITLLNTSLTRRKDQPMNQSIPIDQACSSTDNVAEEGPGLLNVLHDEENFFDEMCRSEDIDLTLHKLVVSLSRFEALVLKYYLEKSSYREIAEMVSWELRKEYDEKSVDNALLRVRKKAVELYCNGEDLPLFENDRGRPRTD